MTSEDQSAVEQCEHPHWSSIGVTVVEGMIARVWVCTDCPAWTIERKGSKYEVPFHETPMFGRYNE